MDNLSYSRLESNGQGMRAIEEKRRRSEKASKRDQIRQGWSYLFVVDAGALRDISVSTGLMLCFISAKFQSYSNVALFSYRRSACCPGNSLSPCSKPAEGNILNSGTRGNRHYSNNTRIHYARLGTI